VHRRFSDIRHISGSTIARGARWRKCREVKLEKGASIEVTFFGEQALSGIVQALDKVTATIAFGVAVGAWAVTVPRDWLRKKEDGWLLEIG
jgi:L-arabinose isomerase